MNLLSNAKMLQLNLINGKKNALAMNVGGQIIYKPSSQVAILTMYLPE